jgi:hypothetical protein
LFGASAGVDTGSIFDSIRQIDPVFSSKSKEISIIFDSIKNIEPASSIPLPENTSIFDSIRKIDPPSNIDNPISPLVSPTVNEESNTLSAPPGPFGKFLVKNTTSIHEPFQLNTYSLEPLPEKYTQPLVTLDSNQIQKMIKLIVKLERQQDGGSISSSIIQFNPPSSQSNKKDRVAPVPFSFKTPSPDDIVSAAQSKESKKQGMRISCIYCQDRLIHLRH